MLNNFYKSLFFGRLFYRLFVAVILLFVLSYGLPFLFVIAQFGFLALLVLALLDYIILFSRKEPVNVQRELQERLSNGDKNIIRLIIFNNYPFTINTQLVDELPVQFQRRDFSISCALKSYAAETLDYTLRPTERGEYLFFNINVFIKSPMGLTVRRKIIAAKKKVKVYPSYFLLKQYELQAYSNNLVESGGKKIRRIGRSMDFEQIKEYVPGDDIRSINWKATARKGGDLMVNHYTDEKSQQIYCIIDKGRVMKMPFEGLTLLDYAINTTLVLSRVALIKQDKAGLITFADQVGSFLPADKKSGQMNNILETLYNQQTKFLETDFEKLYALVRARVSQRSLLVLFTNFESLSALQRQLPYIRSLAKIHLLLIVFFENTELKLLTKSNPEDIEGLYIKTIAQKFEYEKRLMVKELHKYGIAVILTSPQNLTVSAVNKYLEIKARRAI